MKVRCLLYFIAAVAWSYPLTAEIKLPEIFSDGMVFQRDMPVKIWGTADANSQVDVEFAGKKSSAKASADGKWTLNLPPMEASDSPRKMNILENGKPAKQFPTFSSAKSGFWADRAIWSGFCRLRTTRKMQ